MLATERHARILGLVASRQIASTEDLATQLSVSSETIRRDIRVLDQRGQLRRVRGGAASASVTIGEPQVEERQLMHRAEKELIGRLAAGILQEGHTVVLDLGTTAAEVARAMAPTFRGTVATTSLVVAGELAPHRDIEVLICGGRVRAGDLAVSSAHAVGFFAGINADVALVSSGGVDARHGLTDFHLDEIATRRQILANARRAYVLADSSKFGIVAPHFVADLDADLGLISDRNPGGELERELRRKGGAIICP
jgi:DeoR family transcriptional regulator, fructose operon transcriptional repressor